MKFKKVGGSAEHTRFNIDVYCQWPSILRRKSNWYDFTLINVSGEYSPYMGSVEAVLGLLGFIVQLTYVYDFKFIDTLNELKNSELMRQALEAAHPGSKIIDPTDQLKKLDE